MISNDIKLTECQICFERFNKTNKEPKILNCGHTICKECLIHIQKRIEEINCSICGKKQSEKNIEDFTTNRVFYDLLYLPNVEIKNEEDKKAFKVILIGPFYSGKSSLIRQYIYKQFNDKYNVTVGFDFDTKKIKIENQILTLQIWDTAGTELYQSLTSSFIRNSHVGIVVFDITNRKGFEECKNWIDIYRQYQSGEKNELIYLVGNKIDLAEKSRVVSKEEGQNFCINNKLRNYFEVSAKTGEKVENLFQNIAKDLVHVDFKENENIKLKTSNEKKSYYNSCIQKISNIKRSLRQLLDPCGLAERKMD